MNDYTSNYQEDTIKRYQALYEKFKGIYHALLFAQDEGVFEVTVKSQTGAVVVPVSLADGTEIAAMMVENFSHRVAYLEGQLNRQLEEAAHEIASDKKGAETRYAASQVDADKQWAEMAAHQTPEGQLAIAYELIAKHEASKAAHGQKGGAAI